MNVEDAPEAVEVGRRARAVVMVTSGFQTYGAILYKGIALPSLHEKNVTLSPCSDNQKALPSFTWTSLILLSLQVQWSSRHYDSQFHLPIDGGGVGKRWHKKLTTPISSSH